MLEKIQLAALDWGTPSTNPGDAQIEDLTPSSIADLVLDILMWAFVLAGIAFIIIGGIKYATSGGDEKKVASAKNTLLYAIIGIVVGLIGNFIVRFVLQTIGVKQDFF